MTSRTRLYLWVTASKICALIAVILIAVFMGIYKGGFSWSTSTFSFHPLFMTIGVIYFMGDALLSFRVLRSVEKWKVKLVHAGFHAASMIFIICGIYAVFEAFKGGQNVRSLHSWVGIFTVICAVLQMLAGLVTFLIPELSLPIKTIYKPTHVFWGMLVFCLGGTAALLGAYKEALGLTDYSDLPAPALVINFFGVAVVATVAITVYILTRAEWLYPTNEQVPPESMRLTD